MANYFGDWDQYDDYGYAGSNWECSLCHFSNNAIMPVCEICSHSKNAPVAELEAPAGPRALFLSEGKLSTHQALYRQDPEAYKNEFDRLLRLNVAISSANMARITATLAAQGDHTLVSECVKRLSVAEMLSMVKFLDAPRKIRQLKRQLEMIQTRNVSRAAKQKRLGKLKELEVEVLDGGNVTGALAKKIRRQIGMIPKDKLEFYLLMFPSEPWKELADVVHFKPSDFTLDYFLSVVHGAEAPVDSAVAQARECNDPSTVMDLLERHETLFTMYSYLRKKFPDNLPNEVKLALARKAPLEDVLWFYEELNAPGVEDAVYDRMALGESLDAGRGRANYGKLMERLLLFNTMSLKFTPQLMQYAESRLTELARNNDGDCAVAVFGDASGSMEVAINTSTILGSLLSVCFDAELHFFNDDVFPSPITPQSAADVLTITSSVPAQGLTSPASALWQYYNDKRSCDLFIIVGDEDENTPSHDMTFAQLFVKYRDEVNPNARVFLVSFLSGPSNFLGKMNATLRGVGVQCMQFRLDPNRPDLSKLPNLLAKLQLETGASGIDDEITAEALTQDAASEQVSKTETVSKPGEAVSAPPPVVE